MIIQHLITTHNQRVKRQRLAGLFLAIAPALLLLAFLLLITLCK
jgi:hypothetical protein